MQQYAIGEGHLFRVIFMASQRVKDDGFTATAPYYRFRSMYAARAITWIVREFRLDGRGTLLDGGCGTGMVALALSPYVQRVLGFDPSASMLEEARCEADRRGIRNVQFCQMRGEDLSPSDGPCRLVTFGRSLHRMDRIAVAETVYDLLEPGGGIVCLCVQEAWDGDAPWQRAVKDVLNAWKPASRGPGQTMLHQEALAQTRFRDLQVQDFHEACVATVESVTGSLLSTSMVSPAVLGSDLPAFREEVRSAFLAHNPSGCIEHVIETTLISARKTD